jgi:hypothetical protein
MELIQYWKNLYDNESSCGFIECGIKKKIILKGFGIIDSVLISKAKRRKTKVMAFEKKCFQYLPGLNNTHFDFSIKGMKLFRQYLAKIDLKISLDYLQALYQNQFKYKRTALRITSGYPLRCGSATGRP